MKLKALRWAVVLVVSSALALGCSGGGGGGDDDDDDVNPPAVCVGFASTFGAAASEVTLTKGAGSTCGVVVVDVVLTDVTDVFTVSFDATFDPATVEYEGFSTSGSHLASDGEQVQVLETIGSGTVSLGVGRVNTNVGVNFAGSKTVVKLMFSRASGAATGSSTTLSLDSGKVLGSEQPPVQKAGILWRTGTLSIN
jgi:hypothetical protein